MGRVGRACTKGLGTGQLLQPRRVDIPRVQPGSSCCWQTLSDLSHGLPKSEIATWLRSKHPPRPPFPHLPVPAAAGAMGNSLHPFTDSTGSPAPAASTPQAAPNLPARKSTARLGSSPASLPCRSGELVYCWVQGKRDLPCLPSPLAPCPWEQQWAGLPAGDIDERGHARGHPLLHGGEGRAGSLGPDFAVTPSCKRRGVGRGFHNHKLC